jgi:hypothetical protein
MNTSFLKSEPVESFKPIQPVSDFSQGIFKEIIDKRTPDTVVNITQELRYLTGQFIDELIIQQRKNIEFSAKQAEELTRLRVSI